MDENDAQLPLKKRARRRLVGAVFFVSVVAVVLPMVMDHEPRQTVNDVEIRIPGQDEKPFAPRFATPPETPAVPQAKVPDVVPEAKTTPEPVVKPTARVVEVVKDGKSVDKTPEKPVEKAVPKPDKVAEKVTEKPPAKPEKPVEKPADAEARRAAAILAGQAESKTTAKAGEFLILIGAFANEANVKNLKSKLAEQGVKTFSEPLSTPQGTKIRLRAGPFPNREAADKALEKMRRIGVSGVVAAKP